MTHLDAFSQARPDSLGTSYQRTCSAASDQVCVFPTESIAGPSNLQRGAEPSTCWNDPANNRPGLFRLPFPSFCVYGLFCKPSDPPPPPPVCSTRWKTKPSIRIHEHAFSQKRSARRVSRKWNAAFWSFLSGRFRFVRFRHPRSAAAALQGVSSEAGQGFLGAESMLLTGSLIGIARMLILSVSRQSTVGLRLNPPTRAICCDC